MFHFVQRLVAELARFANRQAEAAVDFEQQVRSLAEASLPGLRERMSDDVHAMLRSEARGYVRARARRVVRTEAERQFAGSPQGLDQLVERAIEHLTQRVTRELMTQPALVPATIPVRRVA
jgi:hypothetical protein